LKKIRKSGIVTSLKFLTSRSRGQQSRKETTEDKEKAHQPLTLNQSPENSKKTPNQARPTSMIETLTETHTRISRLTNINLSRFIKTYATSIETHRQSSHSLRMGAAIHSWIFKMILYNNKGRRPRLINVSGINRIVKGPLIKRIR